jgi:hypothetical protein
VHLRVRGHLGRLPTVLFQERLVLKLVHLDGERATCCDDLVGSDAAKAPFGEVASRASAYYFAMSVASKIVGPWQYIIEP